MLATLYCLCTANRLVHGRRFGLNSEPVLKAIEGLPGVSECEGYVYVEEQRQWSSHMTLIRKEYKPPNSADKEVSNSFHAPLLQSL